MCSCMSISEQLHLEILARERQRRYDHLRALNTGDDEPDEEEYLPPVDLGQEQEEWDAVHASA